MTRVPRTDLEALALGILEALSAPADVAEIVSASLIDADMREYGTHGVGLLPLYADMIADGALDPVAEPRITTEHRGTLMVDGERGFGHLTGTVIAEVGTATAERNATVVAGFKNASHIGRTGELAQRIAADGKIMLAYTNSGGGAKNTAPVGSHERKLVPNTIAAGIPTFGQLPFDIVVDFATSQVAGSTVRRYNRRGEPLHEEWTTTESGEPVTNPAEFMAGTGALLPLGGRVTGHKGYGLALTAELLAGFVGGEAVIGEADPTWFANGGVVIIIDPTAFVPREQLTARINALSAHLRVDGVRLPGEGAHKRRERALTDGVRVHSHDLMTVVNLAERQGVDVPETVRSAVEGLEDPDDDVRTW